MESKVSAKDFFIHLGAMAALYTTAIAFINLLFSVINRLYPEIGGYYSPQISFPIATLIIIFPLFILLSWLTYKSYINDPSKKELAVRKWLTYITLFVAGIIFAGDLVFVLYKFLDGQDFTAGFALKALVVLIVTGFVFGYYLEDIRGKIIRRKTWVVVSSLIIALSIILGFMVIGSPQTQRLLRYDEQKLADLQNIQWQVINYWQSKGVLPTEIAELNNPISGFSVPLDPQGKEYTYQKNGVKSFMLCADFNLDSGPQMASSGMMRSYTDMGMDTNWTHSGGIECFERTIDPDLYPVIKPVR